MTNINFIPPRYQQRRVRQVNWRWRALVVCAFAGLIAAGWWSQRVRRQQLMTQLSAARLNRETAEQQTVLLEQAESDLARQQAAASLLVHLRRPWPRTNIVEAITRLAPEEVWLTEISLACAVTEATTGVPHREHRQTEQRSEVAQPPPPGAAGDLDRLEKNGLETTQIRVQGVAQQQAALQKYLAELGGNDLFSAVELVGLEAHDGPQASIQFQLRIQIAPSYGQPGGPEGPPPAKPENQLTLADR